MTVDDLQTLIRDEEAFKKAFRKGDGEVVSLLNGQFKPGRVSYIQQTVLPDGSQIRLKFYDVVKHILNSKGQKVPGKESFLSYIEVSVLPAGMKGYFYTTDVQQRVWGTAKSSAVEKHSTDLLNLAVQAAALGIDLTAPGSWCDVYSENY